MLLIVDDDRDLRDSIVISLQSKDMKFIPRAMAEKRLNGSTAGPRFRD
jgi:hypothetical protein